MKLQGRSDKVKEIISSHISKRININLLMYGKVYGHLSTWNHLNHLLCAFCLSMSQFIHGQSPLILESTFKKIFTCLPIVQVPGDRGGGGETIYQY